MDTSIAITSTKKVMQDTTQRILSSLLFPIRRARQRRNLCPLTRTIPLTIWDFVSSVKTVARHRCRASSSERSSCRSASFQEQKVFSKFSKQELWNETDKS